MFLCCEVELGMTYERLFVGFKHPDQDLVDRQLFAEKLCHFMIEGLHLAVDR